MILTNKSNLPQAIVDAVQNDPYSSGGADISVTQLIAPPRKVALEKTFSLEITEDAADRIWSLLGQSIHTILERANRVGIAERRLSMACEGWTISGGMDLYDEDGVIVDYKTTSAWSCKGGVKEEWVRQLNVYAEILRANGHPVKGLRVVAILRDWSKLEAARDAEYPQSQVSSLSVPLWTPEQAKHYIHERVILHRQARVSLPECSPEERWAKPTVYAVMKPGRKTAVRLFTDSTSAQAMAMGLKDHFVTERPGADTRCQFYCSASKFCSQANSADNLTEETENAASEATSA